MSIKTAMVNSVMQRFIEKMAAPITPGWLSVVSGLTGRAKADAIRRTTQAQTLATARTVIPDDVLRRITGRVGGAGGAAAPVAAPVGFQAHGTPRGRQVARLARQNRLLERTPAGISPRRYSMLFEDF